MSNIASIIAAHHATLVAAATKLQAGKPVWYDEGLIALRHEIHRYMDEQPAVALSTLHLVLQNEARRGEKIPGVNWSGFGFGHNAGHREMAKGLYAKYKHLPTGEAVSYLTVAERELVVKVAKRYTKQVILKLITTTKV